MASAEKQKFPCNDMTPYAKKYYTSDNCNGLYYDQIKMYGLWVQVRRVFQLGVLSFLSFQQDAGPCGQMGAGSSSQMCCVSDTSGNFKSMWSQIPEVSEAAQGPLKRKKSVKLQLKSISIFTF